jgi:hypothetical protein
MRVDHRRNCPPKPGITGVEEGCRSAPVFKGWQSAASPNQARAKAKRQNVWCDCAHLHCATHRSVARYFPLEHFAVGLPKSTVGKILRKDLRAIA